MPGAVADRAFLKLIYGAHPYGHSPIGSEASLAAMNVDDVRAFHARAIRPSVVDADRGRRLRPRRDRAAWRPRRSATGAAPATASRPDERSLPQLGAAQHRAAAARAAVRAAHRPRRRSRRDTPDYHALVVANTILGGQFVSRINLNLREDKGLTYGARTAFEFRRLSGPFVLQVSVQTSGDGAGDRGIDRRDRRHPRHRGR